MVDIRSARILCLGIAAVTGMNMAAPSITATSAPPAVTGKGDPVFERQSIMQRLDEDGELLGNIAAGIEPAEKLAEATRAFANGARESVDAFRPVVPGGRSKPEVWSNHDDFMKRMESFAQNAETMAKAGETGDVQAVMGLMVNAMPCKQCHEIYREPKKPS